MFVRHAEGGSSQVDFQKRLFPPPLSPPFFPIVKGGWLVGGGRRVNCQIALYDFFIRLYEWLSKFFIINTGMVFQWNCPVKYLMHVIHDSRLLTSYFNESWCVYVFSQTYDQAIVLWYTQIFLECTSWTTHFERKCCIHWPIYVWTDHQICTAGKTWL